MTNANDILMGSGAPTAKFEQIGTVVTGTIVREPEARQQRDFRTQAPETWKDGSPKMTVVVQLQTADRDPAKPEDDGTRTLYIQGKNLTDAVRSAVRAAGANGLHTGGTLTVQYVGDGQQAEKGLNPPKLYAASYTPPAVSFAGVAAPAAAPQPPAPVAAPAPAYQPAAVAPMAAPAAPVAVAQPVATPAPQQAPPGVDPGMWSRMAPDQQQKVLAAMGIPAQQQHYGY